MMQAVEEKIRNILTKGVAQTPLAFGQSLELTVSTFMNHVRKKVLLVQGEAFCGKSHYCQLVAQTYANENTFIPLYFDISRLQDPVTQLVEQGLANLGLTSNEIQLVQSNKDRKFLFILDNCDERTVYYNLYATNQLERWANSKVLIATRSIYFILQENDRIYYMPFEQGHGYPEWMEEVTIPAITSLEIEELLSQEKEGAPLKQFPRLESLVTSHRFFMRQYCQRSNEECSFTEEQWMSLLLDDWFNYEEQRLLVRRRLGTIKKVESRPSIAISKACWQMTLQLAHQLNKAPHQLIHYEAESWFYNKESTCTWDHFLTLKIIQ